MAELPRFIKDVFDAFLVYGILAHGNLRQCCGECGDDKLLAFSCRGNGRCRCRSRCACCWPLPGSRPTKAMAASSR